MCGPIAAAFALPAGERGVGSGALLLPQLAYGAGRITTYAFVGGLMGFGGTFVDTAGHLAGVQNLAAVLAGLFMIGAGLRLAGLPGVRIPAAWRDARLLGAARAVLEAGSAGKYYPAGLILGFIPCGLSYSLFLAAAGSGGLLPGMATMIAFGVGTLPAMLLLGSLVGAFGNRLRRRFAVAGGIAVAAMGLLFLSRAVWFDG
jgi:sulfite exporter TauE/SafE